MDKPNDYRFVDLTGKTFGGITVLDFFETDRCGNHVWWVRCECGKEYASMVGSFKYSNSLCFECSYILRGTRRIIHGAYHGTNGRLYRTCRIWAGMKWRCKPEQKYGLKGILVCGRWAESFQNFLADMGTAPDGLMIDRVNNNGHYSCGACEQCLENGWPANCRWATPLQQVQNRSNTIWITHNGMRKTAKEWADEVGLTYKTFMGRIYSGWPVERLLP